MKKVVTDTFEQLEKTFNPFELLDKAVGTNKTTPKDKGLEKLEKGAAKSQNSSPLNFQKLKAKYENQDQLKSDLLKQRLFQLVKKGEQEPLEKKKQEAEQKKQKELYELQEKKRKEEEKKKQEQLAGIPHGKIRRSIFSPKKMAQREQTEVKPASGKQ